MVDCFGGIFANGLQNPGNNLLHAVRSSLMISLYVFADIPRDSSLRRNSSNKLAVTSDRHKILEFIDPMKSTNRWSVAAQELMYPLLSDLARGIFFHADTNSLNFTSGTNDPVRCSYIFSRRYCEFLVDFASFTIFVNFSSAFARVISNTKSPVSRNDAGGVPFISIPRLTQYLCPLISYTPYQLVRNFPFRPFRISTRTCSFRFFFTHETPRNIHYHVGLSLLEKITHPPTHVNFYVIFFWKILLVDNLNA